MRKKIRYISMKFNAMTEGPDTYFRHHHSCGSFRTERTTSRNCLHSPDRTTDETNLHNHQEELQPNCFCWCVTVLLSESRVCRRFTLPAMLRKGEVHEKGANVALIHPGGYARISCSRRTSSIFLLQLLRSGLELPLRQCRPAMPSFFCGFSTPRVTWLVANVRAICSSGFTAGCTAGQICTVPLSIRAYKHEHSPFSYWRVLPCTNIR
ncbi:hypothetical protein EDD15DRAFT_323567 [Pisolithus albus]|nr:hypothetical protein EDD15DRAFT_323567 [Pisolithus albus]